MLSMKTLRVAIVTMGSALLLGPGVAAAQDVIDLDGTVAGGNPPEAQRIATELIPAAVATGAGGTLAHAVEIDDGTAAVQLQVTAKAAVPAGYFIRVELGGAVFRSTPAAPTGAGARVQGGAAGDSQVVYAVPDAGIVLTSPTFNITVDGTGTTDGTLAVLSDAPGGVTATISAHRDQFDAIDGIGALSTRYFGGSAMIIQKVSGISASVSAGTTAVANVGVGFQWFVNDPDYAMSGEANREVAHLGSFTVNERLTGDTAALDPRDGTELAPADLIPSGVHLVVEGDLSIGAFQLSRDNRTADQIAADDPVMVGCPDTMTGSEDSPLMGNVKGTMEMPNTARVNTGAQDDTNTNILGGATGTYTLCVNVDTMGPMSNMSPLPVTEYMGTILLPNAESAQLPSRELAMGVVGNIDRNGASVDIAYLTDADIYNQRLIIVNRANHDVEFTVTEMLTEADTMVTVNDLEGGNMVGMNSTRVVKVSDLFSFEGKNRLGATISFNALPGDISVATSQINLDDFSTDTVMWPVE